MKTGYVVILILAAFMFNGCGENVENKDEKNGAEITQEADPKDYPVGGFEGDTITAQQNANKMYILGTRLWSPQRNLYLKPDSALYYALKSNYFFPSCAAFNMVGRVRFQQGRMKEAIGFYDSAIELDSTIAEPYFNKAAALYVMGDLQRACEHWKQALDLGMPNAGNALGMYCR